MSRLIAQASGKVLVGVTVFCLPVAWLHGGSPQVGHQQRVGEPSAPVSVASPRAFLNRYCVTCHNDKLKTAGLSLEELDVENVSEAAPVWEKVVSKLRAGAMPPANMPRPDKAAYDSIATHLETALDSAAAARLNVGRRAAPRLNRAEYTNAIRDLLGVEVKGESLLPADDSGYGFDNISDVLSVSPVLMERYMSAARQISRLAIGDSSIRPAFARYDTPRLDLQGDRASEDLPFGSRGGIAIRHNFQLDGEYLIRIRLQKNSEGYIIGMREPHQLDVRVDRARVKLFTIGGKAGTGSPEDLKRLVEEEASLEVRFPAKAGTRLVTVGFLDENSLPEGMLKPPTVKFDLYDRGPMKGNPGVESVLIGGPYNAKEAGNTLARQKIFVCHPTGIKNEEPCARQILFTLAHRAYRRPVTDEDLQPLLGLYKDGRNKRDFEASIGMALQGILVNPKFLFRVERDPENTKPGTAYRISDLELASRLSFFLWSSLPDDQLLDLAEQGKLKDPQVLEQQVRRMLADSRSKALVENFAGQWLGLRSLRSVVPDTLAFLDFDESLREAFEKETELFFESMLREDRSVVDLLNANYTFVNERLARHYGIPNIYGIRFRRVTLTDETRWGLLGKGSILTVTSSSNRTSPTLRGKWIMENILGTPPPPPPPNVPALKENKSTERLTMRQRMEQHRANPACASCHSRMDPLGFALENFDGIGKWRTNDAGAPIDASGVLPDGARFQGAAELRKVLASHPEQFVGVVTERMLTYALGRGVEYFDAPALRKIMREAAGSDYRWSALILGIVKSQPFQMRMPEERSAGVAN